MNNKRRILFLPVSSTKGVGEYVRSLCLAKELSRLYSGLEVVFGLNKHAPYSTECPFKVHFLSDSPTRSTSEVINLINSFQPDVVVFDASGRAKQFAHCKRKAIKTVFIAQHRQKLKKGLKLRRWINTDLIMVAQPSAITGELNVIQKVIRRALRKPLPEYVGPIYIDATTEVTESYLKELKLESGNYVVISAGGGGNVVSCGNKKIAATELFFEAATLLASLNDLKFVIVMGVSYGEKHPENTNSKMMIIDHCDEERFNVLVSNCRAAILSGGSSLLQAIASGVNNIVAVPVAADQCERISSCAGLYGIKSCRPEVQDIVETFQKEFNGTFLARSNMFMKKNSNINRGIENGLQQAAKKILALLDDPERHVH